MNHIQTWFQHSLTYTLLLVSTTTPVCSQIIPDTSLGAESSVLTPNVPVDGVNADRIDGGAQRGSNLFHSFSQFNINNDQKVYFSNPIGVQNILTRVTGTQVSNILGTLGVDGNANLFLINPNGIIFGQNARLDVQGSFIASTASRLKFADDVQFSTTAPESTPLLTINIPTGLQFGSNPGRILVQGDGQGIRTTSVIFDTTNALRVPSNQTLALVGGDVSLKGATLKTAGGRIELGSVAREGLVNLTPNNKGFVLNYRDVQDFGDIQLSEQASVDSSGEGGGDVQLTGKRITLATGSIIEASTLGVEPGGSVVVNAQELLDISGTTADGSYGSGFFSQVYSGATGTGGNLTINTGSLLLRDGAQIDVSTFGKGNAGRIEIRSRDTVSLSGQRRSYIGNFVGFGGIGNSGGISINTGSLFLSDKAFIASNVNGSGNSGGVEIVARDLVSLDDPGELALAGQPGTLILSRVNDGAVGNGGDINIKTGSLLASNSQINTSTFGQGNSGSVIIEARDRVALLRSTEIFTEVGCPCETDSGIGGIGNAGDIRIKTGSLFLDGGSNLRADTESLGNAGNIIIEARDSITFSGSLDGFTSGAFSQVEPQGVGRGGDIFITTRALSLSGDQEINTRTQGQGDAGNIFINADSISLAGSNVRIISSASKEARFPGTSGNGGDINITTGALLVTEGAQVTANTEIGGFAGNITINTSRLVLDNQGSIKSESVANADGGNITLNARNLMLMRRNSSISTNAGTNQAGGNGGNININTPFIVAVPQENSDISANAFSGKGGNVNIRVQSIFGIQGRPKASLETSDITASSDLGVQGEISITQLEIQPTQELIELPDRVLDASNQIAQTTCSRRVVAGRSLGEFFVTGRGSLPPSPLEPLAGYSDLVSLATLDGDANTQEHEDRLSSQPSDTDNSEIIEAQGWIKTADGKIALIAAVPETTPSSSPTASVCPVLKNLK